MKPRAAALLALALVILVAPLVAAAQQAARIPRIGFLRLASPPDPLIEAFREGLRQLGYVEGQNIAIEYRLTMEGDRLPDLAAELVRLQVDVIVAAGGAANRAAKKATSTLPIVMPQMTDPTGEGFVASLAHPGGNITGLSSIAPELSTKRLELLKEAFPKISRVAVLWDSKTGGALTDLEATQAAARALGLQLHVLEVRGSNDLDEAFGEARRSRAGALLTLSSSLLLANRGHLVVLAAASRLPVMYHHREYVDSGGLMSYGTSYRDLYRRAAAYADRILKGAKPADLPVEQPTKFELVINMKTARALGLTIPRPVLSLADEVIQ
jgi:putative ABC transport system substrate-binding protein